MQFNPVLNKKLTLNLVLEGGVGLSEECSEEDDSDHSEHEATKSKTQDEVKEEKPYDFKLNFNDIF